MSDISKTLKQPRRQTGAFLTKTAVYTLKNSDSGSTCEWNSAVAFNFNLPPVKKTAKGVFYDFVILTAATSGTGHGVSPDANDKLFTPGQTATDNKDVYFATAGDAVSNGFRIVSDGVDGWHMSSINGTLSQEA